MQNIKNACVVCGYGTKLNTSTKNFLDNIIKFSKTQKIDLFILSGGYTDNKNISEAEFMYEYMKGKLQNTEFILEKKALTTLHNLLYSYEILIDHTNSFNLHKLYIVCDEVRKYKVYVISKLVFKNISVYIHSFHRDEPVLTYLFQIPSIIQQSLGVIFPTIEKKLYRDKLNFIRSKKAKK